MKHRYKNFLGINTIQLVWLLTLVGFLGGVIMVLIVWWTIDDIHAQREKHRDLQREYTAAFALLDRSLGQERFKITNILDGEPFDYSHYTNGKLLKLVARYRKIADSPEFIRDYALLEKAVSNLAKVREKAISWNERHSAVFMKLPVVTSKVESVMRVLGETIDQAEGRQRLARAIRINRFKNGEGREAQGVNSLIIDMVSTMDMSVIRRDAVDLALLCEKLRSTEDPDLLVGLKDNDIRSVLARLRRNSKINQADNAGFSGQIYPVLADLEIYLFGKGYRTDQDHQTIIPGSDGEYGLIMDRLVLHNEQKALRVEVGHVFADVHDALQEAKATAEFFSRQVVMKAEDRLQRAWKNMLVVWVCAVAVFLLISYRIVMEIKSHIKAIEDTNVKLDARTRELRESEERLQRLSSDLLAVQEGERRRISFELHDELGQAMAALKLQVGAISRKLGKVPVERLQEECGEMRQNINQVIENVRRLARDLSPVVLDGLGLQAALEYLITGLAKNQNIEVVSEITDIDHLFDEGQQRLIYRVIQEALTNIVKHSQAKKVAIIVEEKADQVSFKVEDDGIGFDVHRAFTLHNSEKGMGLVTMSERVRILAGRLDIVSNGEDGTRIIFMVPTHDVLRGESLS